jgi:diguanylate cyclase (GGDEF)-like protein
MVFGFGDGTVVTSKGVSEASSNIKEGTGFVTVDGKKRFSLVKPVLDDGVMIGAGMPESAIAAEKKKSTKSLMGFLFALLALTVLTSIVVTRSVGDALKKFASITQELAGGQLSRRIPVTGNDEVAVLSDSFNEMAENLQQRIENLVEARAKMRRQVDLFGEALANATAVGEMLNAVCGLALESTSATHARFWTIDEDGDYTHAACVGLRPTDTEPCGLENSVTRLDRTVTSETAPYWLVVPARSNDQIIGLLTLVSSDGAFSADDVKIAERLGVQAAVAIDNARMHEMLREQATRDGLTGLANHRSMQDTLRGMLADAYKSNMPLGIALMDVDNFKKVNDTYGHQIGDEALKAVARALSHVIGGAGLPARYGGEEFVVVMPGCDSAASCRIADRCREEIADIEVPLDEYGNVLKFTASFGVSNTDQYMAVTEQAKLLNHADMALYKAKHGGKNRVELATPDVTSMPAKAA